MCIESIPSNVEGSNGPPAGVLRVSLRAGGPSKIPNSSPIVPTRGDDGLTHVFSLRWWNKSNSSTSIPLGGRVVYEIRSRRAQFVSYLADCPQRQALEISLVPIADAGGSGKQTVMSGFIPVAALIERLSTTDDANLQVADIPVVLRPRPDSPSSPLSGGPSSDAASPQIQLSVTIDVSFDEGMADSTAIDGRLARLQLNSTGLGDAQTQSRPSPMAITSHIAAHSRHTSLVLGRESLDEVSSEPGWPPDARRMDVKVNYVHFDQSHAPLYVNDNTTVYLTLSTRQDGKDEQRTMSVGYEVKQKGAQGTKFMRASWRSEVITFDPLMLDCGSGVGAGQDRDGASEPGDTLRMSTDSHQSHQSSMSSPLSPKSPTAKSPILRVGLWKSVTIVDQFHSFSAGAPPNDSLIGNAVVVVTGALGEEEGIEIPLYDEDLKKSGVVHMKIGTSQSTLENAEESSIDETSRLNYDILSNMDALKRQVICNGDESGTQHGSRRYATSVSSDDSGACVGVAYEGAVSDAEGDDAIDVGNKSGIPSTNAEKQERGKIIQEDWIFNIEKSIE